MHYVSTRGHSGRKQFCEILREGLAQDGGLYVPESYPRVESTPGFRNPVALCRRYSASRPEGNL
ncbi:hypothetical protein [Bradyrhizobium sp. Gha]|uniref:hypothetical protein n=1 Tax=Bradyrhizobium sp. Gha TaxID=1855318 RepID=UPI001FCD5922|nr:hypothetical protein [Bradyrhizobium sp. Gha]